jgi:hypothetical protein
MLGTVFNQSNIERPAWATGAELLAFVLAGIVLILAARWTYVGIGIFLILVSTSVGGSIYAFASYNFLLDGFVPAAFLLLVGLVRYTVKFVSEFLQKQKIKKQFGGYVSPKIVDLLAKDPSVIERGVKKNISITMTDLRGFTPLGESYGADVEGLRQIMNDYMEAITQPVLNNEGTIIKYIGDASLHINGAPFDQANHEVVAVKTAIEMIEAVGHHYLDTYLKKCSTLLKPNGLGLIQAITIEDRYYHQALKSVDFIKRYIFQRICQIPANW